MAWYRADFHTIEQAKHSDEQQGLTVPLIVSVVDSEAAEQAGQIGRLVEHSMRKTC